MDITTLLALVLGGALGSTVTQARLWWQRHLLDVAQAALERDRKRFETRRVAWARREAPRVTSPA